MGAKPNPQPVAAEKPPVAPLVSDMLSVVDAARVGVAPPSAAAGAIAAGGALTAAAAEAAARVIVVAFRGFLSKRRLTITPFLRATVARQFPERTPGEVARIVADEVGREAEFRRKQIGRLRRDLPDVLKVADPGVRAGEVQRILNRERLYTQMRETAMTERAIAKANLLTVKAMSPEGAYWRLSRSVREHTPDCLAMGEKFWPWEVLDLMHPPMHVGCPCELFTKQEAVEAEWMDADQVPDVKDAVRRARAIMRQFKIVRESAWPGEIDALVEAWHHDQARFAKGLAKGGQFMPKGGVSAVARGVIHRAVHDMLTFGSPRERRRAGAGRNVWLRGVRTRIPEQRHFARTIGGVHFTSPMGSTEVYRNGKWMGPGHPELQVGAKRVPYDLGLRSPGTDEDVAARDAAVHAADDAQTEAAGVVDAALAAAHRDVQPVVMGAPGKATNDALSHAGFHVTDVKALVGSTTLQYSHPAGHELEVKYETRRGFVLSSTWTPNRSARPEVVEPQLDRPPASWGEFTSSVKTFVYEQAAAHGRTPRLTGVTPDKDLGDHTGLHTWAGEIRLGRDVKPTIARLSYKAAHGKELSDRDRREVYEAYKVAAHEGLHAAAPISQTDYQTVPEHRALEEALTEELASHHAVELLHKHGLHDVVEWATGNPFDPAMMGTYPGYRAGLDDVLNRAGVAPEQRMELLMALKFEDTSEQRWTRLGDIAGEGPGAAAGMRAAARRWAEGYGGPHEFFPLAPVGDVGSGGDTRPWLDGVLHAGATVDFVRSKRGSVGKTEMTRGTVLGFDAGAGPVPWTALVETDDGRVHVGVVPGQIVDVVANEPRKVQIGVSMVGPGDVVSYDGISDGSLSEARVDRVLSDTPRAWVIEATTTGRSKHPGQRVYLTFERTGGVIQRASDEPVVLVQDEPVRSFDEVHTGAERARGVHRELAGAMQVSSRHVLHLERMKKSAGHVLFTSKFEYFHEENGDLYRAPISAPVMETTGRRIGRWEADGGSTAAEYFLAQAAKDEQRFDEPTVGRGAATRFLTYEKGLPSGLAAADPHTMGADASMTEVGGMSSGSLSETTVDEPSWRVRVTKTLPAAHREAYALREAASRAESKRNERSRELYVETISPERPNGRDPDLTVDAEWRQLDAESQAAQLALAAAEGGIGGRVFRVPTQRLPDLAKMIAKLTKASAKIGVDPPVTAHVGDETVETLRAQGDPWGTGSMRRFEYHTVRGTEPKIAGWSFLATLQHLDGTNVIRRVPGQDEAISLDKYRAGAPVCDYCKKVRRRKDTYIVRNDEGELKQVGSNCIRDFLGHGDPTGLASYMEYWHELDGSFGGEDDDGDGGGAGRRSETPVMGFLGHVATMIRTEGWIPRSQSWKGRPTADAAEENYFAWSRQLKGRTGQPLWVEPTDADYEKGESALAWVRGDLANRANLSEFEHNMVAMSKGDVVPEKGAGILAYTIVAHSKHMEREIEAKRVAKAGENSVHVGTVGERVKLRLTVEGVFANEGHYGVTYITKLADADGNVFKWFASRELDQGETYEGTFAVKAHSEFRGVKETQITRPTKLVRIEPDAPGVPETPAAVEVPGDQIVKDKVLAANRNFLSTGDADAIKAGTAILSVLDHEGDLHVEPMVVLPDGGVATTVGRDMTTIRKSADALGFRIAPARERADKLGVPMVYRKSGQHVADVRPDLVPGGMSSGATERLFHGTNVKLAPGDVIVPRDQLPAGDGLHDDATHYSGAHVYLSTADHLAERYAVGRSGRLGGDPHVYEVAPVGEVALDPEFVASGFGSDQRIVPSARVVREVPLPGFVAWHPEHGMQRAQHRT